jgi:hypothetical protein
MTASCGTAGYWSVWSSIWAVGALRLTDSMPVMALALLSYASLVAITWPWWRPG